MKHLINATVLLLTMHLMALNTGADAFHGKIVKTRGDVKIKTVDGKFCAPEDANYIARANEQINTLEGSRAVVRFTNGSVTVLGSNSSLGVEKPTLFSHIKGKIFFAFASIAGPERQVRSDSAVYGIRATTFIVDDNETQSSVALKEGSLAVETPDDKPFEVHVQQTFSELEKFKQDMTDGAKQMQTEAEAYINQEKSDFVAYKKSLMMAAGTMIRFDGKKAIQSPLKAEASREFDDFESFAKEALAELKSQEK